MKDYREAIQRLAKNKTNIEFDNKGSDHAAIVLAQMFSNSENNVKLYSVELNSDVTNDNIFMKNFNTFIESKKILRIILDRLPEPMNQSQALRRIIEVSKSPVYNVKYSVATDTFRGELQHLFKGNKLYHFAISDSMAYRVETEATEYKAICNFNDKNISRRLETVFDTNFNK